MSGAYAANGEQNIAASPGATVLGIEADTATRGRLVELWAAASDTPADNMVRWVVRRFTAAGTSTPVTPQPEDPADAAAQLGAGSDHTVEPTYAGTPLLDIEVHLRNTLRWIARDPTHGWVIPATAGAGIGVTPLHATNTNLCRATAMWFE